MGHFQPLDCLPYRGTGNWEVAFQRARLGAINTFSINVSFLHWELVYIYSRERKLLLLLEEEIKICVTTLVKEKMKIFIPYLRVTVLRKNRHILCACANHA